MPGAATQIFSPEFIVGIVVLKENWVYAPRPGEDRYAPADAFKEIVEGASAAMTAVEKQLPADFPDSIHASVRAGFLSRLQKV
jgi:hypothetical protein